MINISKTFSDVFSGGLGFGKKIAILAFMLGMLFLSAPLASSQTEESTPPCAGDTCDAPPSGEPTSNETVIETGDAQSDVAVENTANTSEVEVAAEPAPAPDLATELPSDTNLTVENDNSAEVATEATSTAATGENNANENSGSAVVATGDANASADVINLVNTNIVGSSGYLAILNFFASLIGDLDLRGAYNPSASCDDCTIFSGDLSVRNDNRSYITNDLIVRSGTGENSASRNAGGGIIATGNANAAANIFNITNTNIVGSNYILLVFNNFGSWAGDLVLPSKYALSCCVGGESDVSFQNENDASVENNIEAQSETGDNSASGEAGGDGGLIATGNANSFVNVLNQTNTDIFGSDSVYLAFRFFGDWDGNVFSAPDGFSWMETGDSLQLFGDTDSDGGLGNSSGGGIGASNSNFAGIRNNIRVLALTGSNRANGNGGGGLISTGDANSAANVVNVANTNVIGRNWILALVNIFGNWGGNVAFGRPDLWVGESISEIPQKIYPGNKIEHKLTVINNGDTDATGVWLKSDFNNKFMRPEEGTTFLDDNTIGWNLGTLKPGEARIITYNLEVTESLPVGGTFVTSDTSAGQLEDDEDSEDNFERTSILLYRPRETNFSNSALPDFRISKINGATSGTARPGDSVGYKIILKNDGGGKGYGSKVTDNLYYGTSTESLSANEWELDTVLDGETINITYTLEISPSAKPGVYRNVAKFSAKDELGVDRYFVIAENFIEVLPPEPPPAETAPETESVTQEPVSVEREIKEVVSLVTDYVSEVAEVADETISVPEDTDEVVIEEPQKTGMFRNLLALAYFNFSRIWQWFATTAMGILAALYLKLYG